MNERNKSLRLRYTGVAKAVYLACLGMAGQQAIAQQGVEEITITGSRLIESGVNTPTPVTAVSAAELQTMAPSTLIESLSQLPVFDNNLSSQQAVGGSVAPGGSNLNLRGVGGERTLVLLDGHRLGPSNKFGTVDISVIPEMLVSSVEAVTGGASAAYGADAVAGVVNFRLDRSFTGSKYSFQGGTTTYGDGGNYKVGVAYGTSVGERGHIIASAETWSKNGIRSFESLNDRSDYLDLKAQVTNPNATGPNFLTRSFVSPTNFTAGGVLLAPAEFNSAGVLVRPTSAVDHMEFLPDGSGRYRPLPFSGIGQLAGGCNCQARPSLEYGVDADTEVDTPFDDGLPHLPFPMGVVSESRTNDLDGPGDLTTTYRYGGGYYDVARREFRDRSVPVALLEGFEHLRDPARLRDFVRLVELRLLRIRSHAARALLDQTVDLGAEPASGSRPVGQRARKVPRGQVAVGEPYVLGGRHDAG